MPSMSPVSTASAKRPTMSRSSLEFGSGARSRPAAGRRDSNAARARRSRLLTDGLAGLEHLGDLGGAEAEHVAQHEHRALLRREMLEADDERQRDRLLGLVARLRSGSLVRDPLEQDVGVGLEPDRLAPAGRLGHLGHPLVLRAAPARPQGIQRAVGGDPVQPGTDRRASLELLEAAPRGEQRLLEQVLGVLRRADDPVDVQLELAPVGVGQLAERVLVAGARTGEGLLGHARILAPTLPFTRITSNDVGAARNSPLSFRRGRRLNKRSKQQSNERRTEMGKIVISAERLARRSRPGPGRRGGLQARRLVRPVRGQGPRGVGQGRARRGAARRGPAAGSAERRVLRGAVAIPEWRVGGQVEQPAQVRRVLDPRQSPTGATRRS